MSNPVLRLLLYNIKILHHIHYTTIINHIYYYYYYHYYFTYRIAAPPHPLSGVELGRGAKNLLPFDLFHIYIYIYLLLCSFLYCSLVIWYIIIVIIIIVVLFVLACTELATSAPSWATRNSNPLWAELVIVITN